MKEESVQINIQSSKRAASFEITAPKFHSNCNFKNHLGSNAAALATGAGRRKTRSKFLRTTGRLFVPAIAMIALVVTFTALAQDGERSLNNESGERSSFRPGRNSLLRFRHWNKVANDASGLDHATVAEQLGPGKSSRALAIVHVAIFDSINAIVGGYRSFTGIPRVHDDTSIDSAIAQSAHDTLVAMFPSQHAALDEELADDLDDIPSGQAKRNGITLGRRAAAAILAQRRNDGSAHTEPVLGVDWFTSNLPGRWRQDPIRQIPIALGGHWDDVDPFVLRRANQFRVPPPPPLNSHAYTSAFREVKRLGGDGVVTDTDRTLEQTYIGIYWAYDGTPTLCAPPRLYNQIAMLIADIKNTNNVLELARLMALVNTAMADAGIAIWESKYYYDFWRPVTGIREADRGTGPTGRGDGNPDTRGDITFSPLGAPASNTNGPGSVPNFTPPFPAYPSGHAGFGGALFQILRNFYGTDRIAFTFVSDEFNGVTEDNNGNPRPLIPRSFRTLSEAEEENGQSRIYLGIHWRFDKTEGIAQGRRIANYVFQNAFRPLGHYANDATQ